MFALVDVNNFYASCERLFRPDLKHRPIIVLSNNDGCVVARSQEAKQLGIKMGIPFFKIKGLIEQHQVVVFSSNYTFYADISARVMATLEALAPHVEIYSIDEAFLDLEGLANQSDLTLLGHQVKQRIHRDVGVPVCVGIAPTKTLAKLANFAAKHYPATKGVVDLTQRQRQRTLMSRVPTEEVWGIGARLSCRLTRLGIHSALDFADAQPSFIRKQGSIHLQRTQAELNGETCFDLISSPPSKQQIICSRSFSQRITELPKMREAICQYTSRAAEKLRVEQRLAKQVTVFIRTSGFNQNEPYYSQSASIRLSYPTDDTRDLIAPAVQLTNALWKPHYRYAKAGVLLSDFHEPNTVQLDLFESPPLRRHSKALMSTLDQVNHSGLGTLFFAGEGIQKPWRMKRERLSPRYTTCWKQIPTVR